MIIATLAVDKDCNSPVHQDHLPASVYAQIVGEISVQEVVSLDETAAFVILTVEYCVSFL